MTLCKFHKVVLLPSPNDDICSSRILIFCSLFSDTKLKYQDTDGNIKIFNSGDEKSTEFITFQTLNGYKKLELTGKFELLITSFTKNESRIKNE